MQAFHTEKGLVGLQPVGRVNPIGLELGLRASRALLWENSTRAEFIIKYRVAEAGPGAPFFRVLSNVTHQGVMDKIELGFNWERIS